MIRYILTLLLVLPLWSAAQTETAATEQKSSPPIKKWGIGIVPQYAITSGTRIDIDFRLPGRNQWLVVAPQFYLVTENSGLWSFNEMTGAGLDLQHRLYLGQRPEPRGPWVGYGPVFQYRSVTDDGVAAYHFREEGVDYIGVGQQEMQTGIWKTGANLLIGYQAIASRYFYFDFYLGTGIRFSFDNRTSGLHSLYNEWWGDLGYSGTLMVGGFRFGILL